MKISILCPTRGRVNNLQRLISSASNMTATKKEIEFVFYLDNDDLIGQQAVEHVKNQFTDIQIMSCIGERIMLADTWNVCHKHASGEILMQCGDDIEFASPGWDEIVRKEFHKSDDKIIFVHGNDGAYGDKYGTHGFVHQNWIKTLGYFLPPYFSSDYCDTWLNDVANKIGKRRYIDILTRHHHPVFGLAEWDQTHQERLARHQRDKVEDIYKAKALEREIDALKLKQFILEHKINNLK